MRLRIAWIRRVRLLCCGGNVSQRRGRRVCLRPPSTVPAAHRLAPQKVKAIVEATLQTTPPDATHWSTRTMANAQLRLGMFGEGHLFGPYRTDVPSHCRQRRRHRSGLSLHHVMRRRQYDMSLSKAPKY